MLIEKVIEDNISLSTAELMSANISQVILEKLRRKYVGTCWENAYIINVLEIIKRSDIRMARDRLDGQGDANAQFRVEAIVYPPGDVLTGCVINTINRHTNIICEHEHAVVILKDDSYFLSPKVGQKISVIVQQASYLTTNKRVTIYARPYAIDRRHVLFRVPAMPEIAEDQVRLLELCLSRIGRARDALAQARKEHKDSVAFLEKTMYAYTDQPENVLKKIKTDGFTVVDIEAISRELVSGKAKGVGKRDELLAYMRLPSTNMATAKLYQLTQGWEKGAAKMISAKPQNIDDKSFVDIATDVLNEYAIYIGMIAEMSQIYAKADDRKSHDNIWESYARHQISL